MVEVIEKLEPVTPPGDEYIHVICEDERRVVVKTPHNSIYVEPEVDCSAPVIAILDKYQTGEIPVTCSLGHEATLSAAQVLISLRKLGHEPAEINTQLLKQLSEATGLHPNILSAWHRSLGERLVEYLAFKQDSADARLR